MVGYSFMGAAHSHAWRTAPRFFELPLAPELTALAGRNPERAQAAAAKYGWDSVETDWRRLIERDDIDLIDICSPGNTHAEIAIAALEAGKHVLCEKPLANTVEEAELMTAVADSAAARGVYSMCGFTYRRTPALALAKRMVDDGRLGQLRHVRAQYLQDWLSDADAPLTWRLEKAKSGSGALGDIGAHSIDAAQWITGSSITGVSALTETFVTERPIGGDFVGLGGHGGADGPRAPVTVDDAAIFTARFGSRPAGFGGRPAGDGGQPAPAAGGSNAVEHSEVPGPIGVFEATRFALGRKNAMRLELNGTLGSLAFDFEDMNVLSYYDAAEEPDAGFRRIMVTEPSHPYVGNWWPTGHGLGYEHGFTHQVVDLVTAIAEGRQAEPSFADALQVQRVLAAVEASASAASRWETV
ncbi:Gfo/Idh/MocA family protein [Arthrobacter sp. CJ23]|uniref:Gfo/Idh/MocA family protein n=1 Tax=Arthrobacter sp. CJ23 TaxID=2972479 RepID=UPI00215CA936|nr:Gfo/Idh/MocA family oxidoreductase [Arthrobacter sp. CJ23]UVJ41669.1 Gfo/Idh/MocA family oxidoreductase [Arthrobacter sp. CJ23]